MDLSLALSLVTALYADNSEFALAQRAKLAALLSEKPAIPGIIERLVATPKAAGGYDWMNPNITDVNFPVTAEPNLEGARLDKIVGSREHVLAELNRIGRRAANAAETLLYGQKNPLEQTKYWIWGLGQVWVGPGGRIGFAVVLGVGDACERGASLGGVSSGVDARERVLSFPL